MKYVKWGAGIIVGLAALLFLIGLVLPRKHHVERSVTIDAPAAAIHPSVDNLKEWQAWTPWTPEKYPDMQLAYSGPEAGAGAKYSWDGKSTGQGELTLLTSDPQQGVTYNLAFDHGKMVSPGGIRYAPEGAGTKVTWYFDCDAGWNPIGRYFGLALDSMMGPDFETGLAKLKAKVEAASEKPVAIPEESGAPLAPSGASEK